MNKNIEVRNTSRTVTQAQATFWDFCLGVLKTQCKSDGLFLQTWPDINHIIKFWVWAELKKSMSKTEPSWFSQTAT